MSKVSFKKKGVLAMQNKRKFTLLLTWVIVASLSGCSTYPNKFKCGDAKGLGCTMLREVDTQIDSGRIEEAYKTKKECRGDTCKSSTVPSQELLQRSPKNKATLNKESEPEGNTSDANLYF